MTKSQKHIFILTVLLFTSGGVSAARFAGDAFSLGVGGRGLAMGGAVVAGAFDGSAAYWNPAGMNRLNGRNLIAMHAETFGSLLNHDFLGYVDARGSKKNGLIKSFGFYLYYLGGGGIKITELNEFNRPFVVREESHGDYLLAAAIGGSLSSRLDFGITAKIIYRDIGTENGQGLTADAGLLYQAKSYLMLGLMVSDITTGFIRYSGDTFGSGGNSESIYPTVKPSFAFEYKYNDWTGRVLASGDVKFESLKNSVQYWLGAISLDTHYGWEIAFQEMLFGRAGFDIGNFTVGGGVNIRQFTVDFAYLNHSELDETFRVSAGYNF